MCSGRQNLPWNVQELYHRLGFLRVTRKVFLNLDEASVCGRRAGKWSGERREALCGTKPERNAAAEPQTEGRR